MRRHISILTALLLTTSLAGEAAAQRQPTPEQRIERLERAQRRVERRLFPRGTPVDIAGYGDEPAATQRSVNELAARLDSIERQMAEITRQAEENGNRLSTVEAEFARYRAEQDRRWRDAQEAAAGAASGEPAQQGGAAPAADELSPSPVSQPKVETPKSTAAGDPAEAAYDEGYNLWQAKRYSQAINALRAMTSAFPRHRRVSWANNLIGRALLDSGQPRAAAEALLANYRNDPRGERAPDSLYYLGQALMKLGQPAQACKAYDELREVYGATMRPALRDLLPAARREAKCA